MIRSTISLLFLIASFPLMAQSNAGSPVEYLESIGSEFTKVSKELMSYTSAVSHGKSAKKIEKRRLELLNQLKQAEGNVRRLKPYERDPMLRDSVVEYFDLSYSVINEDYGKIVDLEEIAEQSYDAMEAYMLAKERAGDKLDRAYEKVDRQQDAFVKKYNIKIVEGKNTVSQKLETSAKVYHYYNKIYLLFFKSYKDEAYLLDALTNGKVGAVEQTKQSLLSSAMSGLGTIGPLPGFKGDLTLKTACQQLLAFYKDEAENKVAQLIDFELKRENFEKIKKAFDAKRPSERTQKDIDTYNHSLEDYNKAIPNVNKIYGDLNKKRGQLLDNWNKMSELFLNKHVPRYNG